jgi:predicted nucleic acid-binding protein
MSIIRSAAGTLPAAVERLLDRGLLFHCAVCVAEITTDVANANRAHAGWKVIRDHYAAPIASIAPTRLPTPDAEAWGQAGLIAGTLARTQNYQRHRRKERLNDALIFLTAAKAGRPVLTSIRDEFDPIQQLAPNGRFVHF